MEYDLTDLEAFVPPNRNRPRRRISASLCRRGILSLSAAAHRALGGARSVVLLYDADLGAIGLRPCELDNPNRYLVHPQGKVTMAAFTRHYGIERGTEHRTRYLLGEVVDGDLILRFADP
jgi:hypothetical protein